MRCIKVKDGTVYIRGPLNAVELPEGIVGGTSVQNRQEDTAESEKDSKVNMAGLQIGRQLNLGL